MQPDQTTDKDFIGSIDRSIIGFGLAAIALIPTLFLALLRPSKLWPLINHDHPKGRAGYILSPGDILSVNGLRTFSYFIQNNWRWLKRTDEQIGRCCCTRRESRPNITGTISCIFRCLICDHFNLARNPTYTYGMDHPT